MFFSSFIFVLSVLVFQTGYIGGMESSIIPKELMPFIIRHAMAVEVENREYNQMSPPKRYKYINQNDVWHAIKNKYALQLVCKDFKQMFWHRLQEFTLQEKDNFIFKLVCAYCHGMNSKARRMPPIADMAVNMQASLYPVLSACIDFTALPYQLGFVRVILDSGKADKVINQRDPSDMHQFTLLKLAVQRNQLEMVKLLLKHPTIDVNDTFPLYWAAYNGHTEMVKLLLAHPQIEVNAVNNAGETALFVFVHTNFPDEGTLRSILELLINAGADSTIKNNRGETVLDVAHVWKRQYIDVIKIFEQVFAMEKNNL